MLKRYKRYVVLGISDSHSGFTLGLTNPETMLKDPYTQLPSYISMNEGQTYLWNDIFMPAVNDVFAFAGRDDVYVTHIGDPAHGNKHPSELISTQLSDQIDVAISTFAPVLSRKNVKACRIAEGTAAHNFGEASAETLIETRLQKEYPKVDIRCVRHGLLTLPDGFRIDYAHHGPSPGNRIWTKGNTARSYLRSEMQRELNSGKIPANFYMRGHFHEPVKEWATVVREDVRHESWLMILPSMCLMSEFASQSTKSQPVITNGVIALEIINGKLTQTLEFTQTDDLRTEEILC